MKFSASAFSGAHARWFRLSVATILLMTLLGLVVLGSGCSSDDSGDIVFPEPDPPETMDWLFDVYGLAADDVYACGNKGAMFHYDGTDWSYVDMGTGDPITAVWGPGDGTLYAAGHGGRLWQLSGGSWNSVSSGTSEDIYGLGIYNNDIHLCGAEGTLRRLSGNSWVGVENLMVVRTPPPNNAPEDTLLLNVDVESLLTVNQYFVGGAYRLPDYEGERVGLEGTDGMVMSEDIEPELFDWQLRPLRADQLALSEWIICSTSSAVVLGNNYLGTSEGWLFKLTEGESNSLAWSKMSPDLTVDPQTGIRDLWLDVDSNLYMVLDTGELVFQTEDYNFGEDIGMRKVFEIAHGGLTSVWGSDRENLFMTGFNEEVIYQASMDFADTTLTVTAVPVAFPNKGGQSIGLFEDHVGMPRF